MENLYSYITSKCKNFLLINITFQPLVPQLRVDEYKEGVSNILDDHRIGPELRIQDFDDFLHLINGDVLLYIFFFHLLS